MGGVDRADRRRIQHSIARKTLKWNIKLLCSMFDVLISNSNIICNLIHGNNIDGAEMIQMEKVKRRDKFEKLPWPEKTTPKHVFMRKIVEESLWGLHLALKRTHRNNNSNFVSWNAMNPRQRAKNKEYLKWVKPMSDKQVRLARISLPEKYRAIPDRRQKDHKSPSNSASKTKN